MIRPKSKERSLRTAVVVGGDFLIGCGALYAIVALRHHGLVPFIGPLPAAKFILDAPMVVLFALALVLALALSGFYQSRIMPRTHPSFLAAAVIQAALVAIGGTILVRPLPRSVLLLVPIAEMIALPFWRRILAAAAPIRARDTILIGDPRGVDEALTGLRLAGDTRIRVKEVVRPTSDQLNDPAMQTALREIDEVILVSPDADARLRLELLRIRGARGFLMLASHVDALLASRTHGWVGDQPLVEVAASCGYGVGAAVKRSLDLVGAVILILASAPLWLVISIAIRLADGGPVLVRQRRLGLRGEPYGMWKFRSMHGPADAEAFLANDAASPERHRVTRVGALLRRYHLDELPQLINVLAADMSLVGPRPERPELVARILHDVPDFDLRSLIRPGIAGLAQVSAEYDTRPEVKLRYDLMYMCDWSVWLDMRLLFRAVSSSLAGTGR